MIKKKIIITAEGDYKGVIATLGSHIMKSKTTGSNIYNVTLSNGTKIICSDDSFVELTDEEIKEGWDIQDSCLRKDSLFMHMAMMIAMRSKDPSTKVGAVIVGSDDEVVSMGYNGFPRKVYDLYKKRYDRPEKYYWTEHAERNAIFNAARIGVSCKDTRIYTMFHPCPDCARAIIQSGIKEIIIHGILNKLLLGSDTLTDEKLEVSKIMLMESGVETRYIHTDIKDIFVMVQSKKYYDFDLWIIDNKEE